MNLIDVMVVGILLRSIYIGFRQGAVVELFKLLGMIFAIFLCLHYYLQASALITEHLDIGAPTNEFFAFAFLWLMIFVVFKIVYEGIAILIRNKIPDGINKIAGITLGLTRGILVGSLAIALVYVSKNNFLTSQAQQSFGGFYVAHISIDIYEGIYYRLIKPAFPSEEKNEALKDFGKKEEAP
ncbi:MAG: CvpA family protein [Candidatus Omnitrophica bacterium]|nr:CvpA family protein [Candidatus Omnitrophota bacterium]